MTMLGERYFHCQGAFRSTEFYEISSRSLFSPTVSIYNNVNEVAIALSRTVFFRDLFHVLFSLCLKRYPIFVALFAKVPFMLLLLI